MFPWITRLFGFSPKTAANYENIEELAQTLEQTFSPDQIVDLSGTTITQDQLVDLVEKLKLNTIKSVNLSHTGIGDDEITELIKGLQLATNLQILNLSHTNITSWGLHLFAVAPKYMQLSILNLSHTNITDLGVEDLAMNFYTYPYLKHLDLSHNLIENKSAWIMANLLCHNTSLLSLNLSHTFIGDIQEMSIYGLGEILFANRYLKRLDLSYTRVSTGDVAEFIPALKKHKYLHSLDLRGLNLDSTCLEYLNSVSDANKWIDIRISAHMTKSSRKAISPTI